MADTRPHNTTKAIIGGILGIIIALAISFMTPPKMLGPASMRGLGIFVCAVVWWIMDVLPDYVVAVAMCVAWTISKSVPFATAFAAFAGTTFWLLIGALGLGVAVAQSGLLQRTALLIMSKFPPTYKGQTKALLIAGTIIGPLIPSTTAKCAVVAPFATAISDNLGFERKSEGAAGLFASLYSGFAANAPLFLSASFLAYTMRGLLPQAVQNQMTWMTWFLNALPWGIVVTLGSYFAVHMLYKPKHVTDMSHEVIKGQLEQLGPMKKNEKIVLAVLVVSLILWMTQRLHNIDASLVADCALIVLLGCKIFDRQDFKAKIAWDSIILVGGILNLSTVLPALKIDKWIASILGPYITPLTNNIWAFAVVVVILIFLVRTVIVDQAATITIFTVLLIPFAVKAGINPWVPGFIVYVGCGVWNFVYQTAQFLAGLYATNGLVEHPQMVKMSVAYMILCVLGLMASIPLWKITGLVP